MISLQLAFRDWLDEWPTSICLAVGVAAGAIPLLLLLSIRTGIIGQLRAELERFPSSRELVTIGQPSIRWALVQSLSARPDVAFVAPLTRLLSASAVLRTEQADHASEIDLVPSGRRDPLLPEDWHAGGLVLPENVSRILGVARGDRLNLVINRTTRDGRAERATFLLPIYGVIPVTVLASSRRMALIDPSLLLASEIWREDPEVPTFADALARAQRDYRAQKYAGVRLFAKSVDDVEAIRSALLKDGVETESHVDEIRLIHQLDQGLRIFLLVISSVTVLGLCLSLAAAQWGWVERKRFDLSYLRLIGLGGLDTALIPLWQSLLTVSAGFVLALAFAWIAHDLINDLFVGQFAAVKQVSVFDPLEILMVGGMALVAGGVAAVVAAFNVQRISPITALRGA